LGWLLWVLCAKPRSFMSILHVALRIGLHREERLYIVVFSTVFVFFVCFVSTDFGFVINTLNN
jgi:hypothetical protein